MTSLSPSRRSPSTFTRLLSLLTATALLPACARSGDQDGSASRSDSRFSPPQESPAPPPLPERDAGDPFGAPAEDAGYETCSKDSWCEVASDDQPLPSIQAVWGFAPNDVWFAGEAGSTLHYDGSKLTRVETGTKKSLRSLWGASPDDLWAVGADGALLHWNGSTWASSSKEFAASLYRVWGRDAHQIWAVGVPGTILRGDGTLDGWSPVAVSNPGSWAFSSIFVNAQDGWATFAELTNCPGVAYFSASANQPVTIQTIDSCTIYPGGLWSNRAGEAWMAGWSNDSLHQTQTGIPAYIGNIVQLGVNESGAPFMKKTFTLESHAQLRAIWGVSSQTGGEAEIWAVGDQANIVHRKDGNWSLMRTARNGRVSGCSLFGVWASSASDVWTAGSCEAGRGIILRRTLP